jgi:hypothetical protein
MLKLNDLLSGNATTLLPLPEPAAIFLNTNALSSRSLKAMEMMEILLGPLLVADTSRKYLY